MTHPSPVHVSIDFVSPGPGTPALRAAFAQPLEVLAAHSLHEVRGVLDAVQAHAKAGRWCAGFVRYEAAPAFDAALATHPPRPGPLAWFGVFDEPRPWPVQDSSPVSLDWHTPLQAEEARAAIASIHSRIAAGEVYQVNHTARMRGTLRAGSPHDLFAALQRFQPGTYAACIDTGAEQVLSVSPELFFDWRADGNILSRPMKGTAARGASAHEDAANVAALRASLKERAENVMIVDLIRNDLSRIAELHSVAVPRLFHVEALPTVWSMTSDVTAKTRSGTTLAEVFAALFPCGSVTGAPKVQAMRTIRELEPDARGVYCGAVGVVRPGGAATFNVAIRTLEFDGGTEVCCGIGSGVTIDATFDGEWAEWGHKAAFVRRASEPFALLETLRIEDGAARNAEFHLTRLAASAWHFGYPCELGKVAGALEGLSSKHPRGVRRARLLLHADGRLETEAAPMLDHTGPALVRMAPQPMREAGGEFVRHKTTRRAHYDAFAPTEGVFDTLLWNEAGEVTEFTRGNVAVKIAGHWITPPLASGLLPGVGRAQALAAGTMKEQIIRIDDLAHAEEIAFLNSLRGWIVVKFELN
ncbi:para-aminobenzoate synthetase / 4-amino-4-deoxychorismate lyase [Variovorax sp. HW608]|uniref:chorismate-binding protein n=1 Tax=Variovorax sp. HW608 TaxID=1034889 RepID=UPI00081FACC2|nr:chorismate-binding protein [Variovorax sp. HW608]SCK17047.1 para-aminobenzoate synthetase / 4-amino-4-deoxychorismate lyase [Variovorax sp. HW608]